MVSPEQPTGVSRISGSLTTLAGQPVTSFIEDASNERPYVKWLYLVPGSYVLHITVTGPLPNGARKESTLNFTVDPPQPAAR